jgi:hypothetical protein
MVPKTTRLEWSMTPDTQPVSSEIALRVCFEHGCRDLNNSLNIRVGLLAKRIDHAYQELSKRDANFASLANLLIEDIGHASGLIKPLPPILAETGKIKSGEDMPFHDPLLALRLLLDKDKDLFPDKDRKALLARIDKLEGPKKECNSIKLKLDILVNSLEPLYALSEQLRTLLGIFGQLNEEVNRLSRIGIEIKRLEGETIAEDHDAKALRIDRPKLAMEAILRELEEKLNSEKAELARDVALLKQHFAMDKRLVPAIAGILNEIQFLCGDLVIIRNDEIPEWETDLAKQGLTREKTNLPDRSILSGIHPDIVDAAFAFIKEHESFLVAYERVKKARKTIAGTEIEILAAQDRLIGRQKHARATKSGRTAERKHHNTRLEQTAEETEAEIDGLTAMLFEELEKLRTKAGIVDPLEKIEPEKFWAEIAKGFGCGALEDAEKQLDTIEPMIQKLDMKI